jgi:hypothetical protein
MEVAPRPAPLPTLTESQHKVVHRQKIKTGRGWILAVAIMQLFTALVCLALAAGADGKGATGAAFSRVAVVVGLLGLIYLGLWIWAKRSPFAAALVALVFFLSLMALDAVMNPASLVQGILIKLLIVAGLAQAVRSSYAMKKAIPAA